MGPTSDAGEKHDVEMALQVSSATAKESNKIPAFLELNIAQALLRTFLFLPMNSDFMCLLSRGGLLEPPGLTEVHFWLALLKVFCQLSIICTVNDRHGALRSAIIIPHWICLLLSAIRGKLLSKYQANIFLLTNRKCLQQLYYMSGFFWTHAQQVYFCVDLAAFLFFCAFLGGVYQIVFLCWPLQLSRGLRKCSGALKKSVSKVT